LAAVALAASISPPKLAAMTASGTALIFAPAGLPLARPPYCGFCYCQDGIIRKGVKVQRHGVGHGHTPSDTPRAASHD
jgi:hypothetical protein